MTGLYAFAGARPSAARPESCVPRPVWLIGEENDCRRYGSAVFSRSLENRVLLSPENACDAPVFDARDETGFGTDRGFPTLDTFDFEFNLNSWLLGRKGEEKDP